MKHRRTAMRRLFLPGCFAFCAMVCGFGNVSAQTGAPPSKVILKSGDVPALPAPVEEGTINFSFDQVDVRSFVKLAGELTGYRFVVADNVEGKITIVSPRISRRQAYPLFVSILESVGCSVVEEGDLKRVVKLPERAAPGGPVIGAGQPVLPMGVMTKVFRIEHVSASELRKAIESTISGGKAGGVSSIDETNHLIVTDTGASIRRVEQLIREIDRPGLARVTQVVTLQYASAGEVADQLNMAVSDSESRGEVLRRRLPDVPGASASERQKAAVIPAPHSNSLILVGSQSQIDDLRALIAKIDVDAPSGRGRLNAIFLKYLGAEEAARTLNAVMNRIPTNAPVSNRGSQAVAIEASLANNALVVDASPGDFDVVRKLVEQLDKMPQQVHISVMIAEVGLTDDFTWGMEIASVEMPTKVGSTVVQGSTRFNDNAEGLMNVVQQGIFPRGITVGVAQGTGRDANGAVTASFPGVVNIDALRKKGKFDILSETSLEAQNNREASVSIVNEIPVLKSTIEGGSGTARDVIQNIERIDVGIKLKLTPHIIPGGEVQMSLNPSIEAVIDPGPSGTQFAPTIAKREVSTTVTVPDGRTIVIAGLTRQDKTKIVRKFPILGSIPIIGLPFRHTVETTEKTNLLILVTPHVVTDMAAADRIMEEWKKKTRLNTDEGQNNAEK